MWRKVPAEAAGASCRRKSRRPGRRTPGSWPWMPGGRPRPCHPRPSRPEPPLSATRLPPRPGRQSARTASACWSPGGSEAATRRASASWPAATRRRTSSGPVGVVLFPSSAIKLAVSMRASGSAIPSSVRLLIREHRWLAGDAGLPGLVHDVEQGQQTQIGPLVGGRAEDPQRDRGRAGARRVRLGLHRLGALLDGMPVDSRWRHADAIRICEQPDRRTAGIHELEDRADPRLLKCPAEPFVARSVQPALLRELLRRYGGDSGLIQGTPDARAAEVGM